MGKTLKSKPAAGFCKLHKKVLKYPEIKDHGCIDSKKQRGKAQCNYLVKYESHPIWEQRELIKKLRKEAKDAKKAKLNSLLKS